MHEYQKAAVEFAMHRLVDMDELGAGIFADPGLGKTLMSYEIIRQLQVCGLAKRTLVVAPLRPCYSVWPEENKKWGYDFKLSIVHGPSKQRALYADAEVYLINPEAIKWLDCTHHRPFDLIIVDESTKFKNHTAVRSKHLRRLLSSIPKRIILTGTPAPNCLADLFHQFYILDGGKTLGKTLNFFRSRWMRRDGNPQWNRWVFRQELADKFYELIDPFVIRMDALEHLSMPELIVHDVWVDLPSDVYQKYARLEDQLWTLLDSGNTLVADTATAAYTKCKQFASGVCYDGDGYPHEIHRAKLEALVDIQEELFGKPLLTAFQFRHEVPLITSEKSFSQSSIVAGGTSAKKSDSILRAWNTGLQDSLLIQPQSACHGLNLQKGRCQDIAWFGLTDQLESYIQLNARIWRQGQSANQVRIHRILARNTVDEAIRARIEAKTDTQNAMLHALKRYRERQQ